MSPVVDELSARLLRIPLHRPWGEDVREIHVVAVDVVDSEGAVGHGFSWTPTIGPTAVLALLSDDIRDFASGRTADAEELWPQLWARLHEAGPGGITTIAMAGLDLALWDLAARRSGTSISGLLGQRHDEVACYGSGVNLHYSRAELVAQVRRWVDAGYDAVKVKVGKPDLAEDVDRIGAVREVLGPHRGLMIDANQRWSLDHALRAVDALAPFSLDWLEEPLRADDLAGHVRLRAATGVPIALGENVHTVYRFREFIEAGAVDVIQPNVIRVGGITPFLEISRLADATGTTLAPHLLPEISGQLALALTRPTRVEDVEDAGFGDLGALTGPSPVAVRHGRLHPTPHLGIGLDFRH
ncbi:mandelate racemase/muconate lactonizing enzyme family protein [Pseudolysinimonas sp.]|uniref:mandelate racemase/muconate lactonizing enzyme family protein n=1 Tax=Pseudolysinimonas sp. TaxID=2680009 RepID=UPI003F816DEB